MRSGLLFFVFCSVLVVGCGSSILDYANNDNNPQDQQRYSMKGDGIEECISDDHAVYSVAQKGVGTNWNFFYHGEAYSLDSTQLTQPATGLPAQILQDQVTLKKCSGQQLVVRQSVRHVVLRNNQHQVMFDGELNCVGYPPNGLDLLPDEDNLCQ